ncbi:N-acetylglucosamine-1-phosphotransferase subunits alpha/beta-like isoform X1 [Argonauta hians]
MRSLCKFIQRQAYTILSYKYGTTLFFFGFLFIVVSAFQFGETVMQWSQRQYITMFSSFTDNVAGHSFKHRLCSPMPIDIVYTWVNGSDLELISELQHVKKMLQTQLNESRTDTCSFSDCVPAHLVVFDPGLPTSLTLNQLRWKYALFNEAIDMTTMNSTDSSHTVTLVSYENSDAVTRALNNKNSIPWKNHTVNMVYYSSDWTLPQGILMKDVILMSGIPFKHGMKDVKKYFPSIYQDVFSKIDSFKDKGIAVLHIKTKFVFEEVLQLNITIGEKLISFSAASIVWDLNDYSRTEDFSPSRFEDNEELKYSLRSIEKYAPWVHNIFIVTNGQIPSWLNLDNPRLHIVTHEDIFMNKSHLPTFSSPAIEANLHRIPGISDKFIYLNDDVMFGKEVWPDDFYSHSTGQKVYLTWPTPNCAENCPAMWIKDGYCDKSCNNSRCDWDGGDCEGQENQSLQSHLSNFWPADINIKSNMGDMYCNTGCANSWLADRYCDQSCNVYSCGYDVGDCGLRNFNKIHKIELLPLQKVYHVPATKYLVFFNLTNAINQMGEVKSAQMDQEDLVRKAAISLHFNVMTVLMYLNQSETTIACNITFQSKALNTTRMVSFHLNVNTNQSSALKAESEISKSTPAADNTFINETQLMLIKLNQIPESLLKPHAKKSSIILLKEIPDIFQQSLPNDIKEKLDLLKKHFDEGDLTEKGYKIQKYSLWNQWQNQNLLLDNTHNKNSVPNLNTKNIILNKIHTNMVRKSSTNTQPGSSRLNNAKQQDITVQPVHKSRNLMSAQDLVFKRGIFPWEKSGPLVELQTKLDRLKKEAQYSVHSVKQRKLLDTFADSILHVNRLYNREFGYITRKVPAHMPHMIDKNIMAELQSIFPEQWAITSSHKVRSSDDMQFAFSYFYYLIGATENVTAEQIFDEMDTDVSGILSDREIRTLATRLFDLPLDLNTLLKLENIFINCSRLLSQPLSSSSSSLAESAPRSSLLSSLQKHRETTEKYYEGNMPQINKEFFLSCPEIQPLLHKVFKPQPKYKHVTSGDGEIAFKMIKTNISLVVAQLDDIRKHPKKFICLNDNIDHSLPEAKMVKAILNDFFESLFPKQSHFELPKEYRNRFLRLHELQEWQKYRNWLRFWTYLTLVVLVMLAALSFCSDRIESLHRRYLYRRPTSQNKNKHSSVKKGSKMMSSTQEPQN